MTQKLPWTPGFLLVAAIGGAAFALARWPELQRLGLGPLTVAIVLGAVLGNCLPRLGDNRFRGGLGFAQRRLLRIGVALYGFNLSAQQIVAVGGAGMLVDITMVVSTLAAGWLIGRRLLGLDRDLVLLASAGSAICGAAAVVATVPLLRLDEQTAAEKSAIAVATVVLFGTLAMFLYPAIYGWLGPGNLDLIHFDFGLYVGSTVHEVAQVVAIGSALGDEVARNAVIAKMIRVLLLMPFLVLLGTALARRDGEGRRAPIPVPWFAVAFVAIAGINSLAIVPEPLVQILRDAGILFLTVAMAALGIDTNARRMGRAGFRPLLLGGGLFAHLILFGGLCNGLAA